MKLATHEEIESARNLALQKVDMMRGASLERYVAAIEHPHSAKDRLESARQVSLWIEALLNVSDPLFDRTAQLGNAVEPTILEARAQGARFLHGKCRTVFQEVNLLYIFFRQHMREFVGALNGDTPQAFLGSAQAVIAHVHQFEAARDWLVLLNSIQEEAALARAYVRPRGGDHTSGDGKSKASLDAIDPEPRVETWKRIAASIYEDIRTAQRRAKEDGMLKVASIPGQKRVFCLQSEIDRYNREHGR